MGRLGFEVSLKYVPVWRTHSLIGKMEHIPLLCHFGRSEPLSVWGACFLSGPSYSVASRLSHVAGSSCIFMSCIHAVSWVHTTLFGSVLVYTQFLVPWTHPLLSELIRAPGAVALPSVASSSWFFFGGLSCFRWSESTGWRWGHVCQNTFPFGTSALPAALPQYLSVGFLEVEAKQLFLSPGLFFPPLNSKMTSYFLSNVIFLLTIVFAN